MNGEQSGEEFVFETGKNIFTASAVGGVGWATVVLGASPGGLVVAAAAIGTQVIVAKTFETMQLYRERQHLSLREFVGKLPAEIQGRIRPFGPDCLTGIESPNMGSALVPIIGSLN